MCALGVTPTHSRDIITVRYGQGEQNDAQGGRGSGWGAQVVANRGLPEVPLIYTVSTKKCQKRSKLGYPLFLTHFQVLSA